MMEVDKMYLLRIKIKIYYSTPSMQLNKFEVQSVILFAGFTLLLLGDYIGFSFN